MGQGSEMRDRGSGPAVPLAAGSGLTQRRPQGRGPGKVLPGTVRYGIWHAGSCSPGAGATTRYRASPGRAPVPAVLPLRGFAWSGKAGAACPFPWAAGATAGTR